MAVADGSVSTDISTAANIENQLVASLVETADELARNESLDNEQRAEVYAIIDAIRTDTEAHRAVVELLKRQLSENVAHA